VTLVLGFSEAVTAGCFLVVVASLGLAGTVYAARVGRETRRVGAKIGTPNGRGDVVQMVEQLLDYHEEHDRRAASMEQRLANAEGRLAAGDSILRELRDGQAEIMRRLSSD